MVAFQKINADNPKAEWTHGRTRLQIPEGCQSMRTHFGGIVRTSRFWILAIVLLPITILSAPRIHAGQARYPRRLQVDWRRHVETSLLQSLETQDEVEFILFLEQQADFNLTDQFPDKETKGRFVFETLHA